MGVSAGFGAHLLLAGQSSLPAAPALPELHGQATWPAGKRPAPLFTLRNAVTGSATSLSSLRGHMTLIAFLDSRCHKICPVIGRQIGDVQRSLSPAVQPRVIVVSVDPAGDTAPSVRAALRHWHAPAGWRWLSGTQRQLAEVWRAYGIEVQPTTHDILHSAAVYLVDPRGYERAGYLAPLLPNFVELDIRRVAAASA